MRVKYVETRYSDFIFKAVVPLISLTVVIITVGIVLFLFLLLFLFGELSLVAI